MVGMGTIAMNENNIKTRIHVHDQIPSIVIGDSIRLTQILNNLVGNAIKFTRNGEVEISVVPVKKDDEKICIAFKIKDTGVGMSEVTINKLFKLDENVTMPGTNNEKGTGLGLTICNDIVKLNGWKMNIDSHLGNGTTFKILIPN